MLLHLVSDYIRNVNGVQDRFARDPIAVIEEYGLSAIEAHQFANPAQLVAKVASEVASASNGGFKAMLWGVLDMTIHKVVPPTGTAGNTLQLKIVGEGFTPNVKVAFQQPGIPLVNASQVSFASAEELEVTVVLASPGSYGVRVWEDTTPPNGGWLDAAVVVSA